jgi:hypothetical protein
VTPDTSGAAGKRQADPGSPGLPGAPSGTPGPGNWDNSVPETE